MPRQTDVRVQKTKERLSASLLSLLKEKSIEKVSICEICNRAGVNRNTFYSHYLSVKELLEEIEAQFLGNSYDLNCGSATSLLLMVVVLITMAIFNRLDSEDAEEALL